MQISIIEIPELLIELVLKYTIKYEPGSKSKINNIQVNMKFTKHKLSIILKYDRTKKLLHLIFFFTTL